MMIPDELKEYMIRMAYHSLLDDISAEVDSVVRKISFEDVYFLFNSSIDEVRNNPITINLFTCLKLKYSNIPKMDLEYIVIKSLKEYGEEMFNNMKIC